MLAPAPLCLHENFGPWPAPCMAACMRAAAWPVNWNNNGDPSLHLVLVPMICPMAVLWHKDIPLTLGACAAQRACVGLRAPPCPSWRRSLLACVRLCVCLPHVGARRLAFACRQRPCVAAVAGGWLAGWQQCRPPARTARAL
jgi:hypothetical protein